MKRLIIFCDVIYCSLIEHDRIYAVPRSMFRLHLVCVLYTIVLFSATPLSGASRANAVAFKEDHGRASAIVIFRSAESAS